jgi:hypothetical protein
MTRDIADSMQINLAIASSETGFTREFGYV